MRDFAVLLGLVCLVAVAPGAKAQQDPVTVDWGALDAVGAGNPGAATIKLIAPPKRVVAVMPPAEKPAAPKPVPVVVAAAPPPRPPVIAAPTPPQNPAQPAAPHVAMTAVPRAVGVPPAAPGQVTTVRYEPGASDLPPDGKAALDKVAATLAADSKARLQLVAYASGSAADPVAARRVSLTRAVQMRAYLIAKGVQSVRMEVRALGDQNVGTGPADRVDLVIVDR